MNQTSVLHRIWRDFSLAVTFFTRIPLSVPESAFKIKLADAAWAFPIVGLIVGLIAAGAAEGLLMLGAPAVIAAGVALILMVLITGALHEDGLADTADGLGGAHTVERKLEIMRDSSTGVYGLIALVMSLLLRFVFIHTIIESNNFSLLIVLPLALMISRAFIGYAMSEPGQLKDGGKGLGQSAGVAANYTTKAWLGVAIGSFAEFSIVGAIVIFFTGIMTRSFFVKKIGGMTGDGYGFVEQITQVTALAAFAWIAA